MRRYIIKRLIATVPVLLIIAVITFSIMHLAPGDPATMLLGDEATAKDIADLRESMGLDRPFVFQFGRWLSEIFRGNLGRSVYSNQSVLDAIIERLEPTIVLAMTSMGMAILIAIPLGVLSAWFANRWIDRTAMVLSVLGFSIPGFWLGMNIMYIFGVKLRLFPVMGYVSFSEGLIPFLQHLIMPLVTLGLVNAALIARMTRSCVLEVLREDYIRTAFSKGVPDRLVLLRHALRNAALPIMTIIGVFFAGLLAGVVVTETVFAIPGIGRLIIEAVVHRDYPIIQGVLLITGAAYVFINLLIDILYTYFDPRVRY